MSKRYLQWGYDSFKDTKTGEISDNHIHILNKQAEQIAELEEQLKNKQYELDFSIYTKQVRKEVCEKIYNALTSESGWHRMKSWYCVNDECEELREFLDQIQGVEDGTINNEK